MDELDEIIKKDVIDQLYWDDRLDSNDIKVSVENGKVTLRGKVRSFAEKNAASADAWTIYGVRSIINQINAVFPSTLKVPTDDEIRENVETALDLASDVDDSDIQVNVLDGVVTLRGTVPSFWQKSRIEHIIMGITGVYKIVDELSVVPTKSYIDKEIAKEIIAALERNYSVDVKEINVLVEDGIVTLRGSVIDWKAYDAIINTTKLTAGVIDIKDQLEIKGKVF